jgi:hypothetical protein
MLSTCFLLTRAILKYDCFFDKFRKICKHRSDLEKIISLDYFLDNLVRVLDDYDSIAESLIVFLDMEEHDTLEALVEYMQQGILGYRQESRR